MPHEENNKDVVKRTDSDADARKDGKNYMLVIGIDDYAHCPTLFNAVKDAKDIVEVLLSRFRFESANIETLYNEKATKANIYKAFEFFAERITPKDNFLLYFSGHGEFKKLFNLGYWIPVEAQKEATHEFISNIEVKNILSSIKSHHTFLMADSCFSGSLFAKGTGKNVHLRKERDPSRWGLTAGRNEVVTDGTPGQNSPFAESILYELRNATAPLGVATLCDKVLEVVVANAHQTPRGEPLKVEGHRGGQFVFHLKMDEAADWKNALATNTVVAFQSFIAKYPERKNTLIANQKIKAKKADALWQKIETAKDGNINEVNNKLRLINQFVANYEDQPHYDEGLNIGELLEYKRQYLQAKNSEFALRRFLRKPIPNVDGASLINGIAQEKLANWENALIAEEPAKIITPKKKPVEKKKIRPSPNAVASTPSTPKPSLFEKYGKYLLWLLIPLVGFGIYQTSKIKTGTPDKEPTAIEDKKSKEDPKVAALTTAKEAYQSFLTKGDNELRKSKANYQTAKDYYQEAIKSAEGFAIDTKEAETGVKKCDEEIAKLSEAEKERQRKVRAAKIQKEYDELINDGSRYYVRGDYGNALAKYKAAKGKVKNDAYARRGISNCEGKLVEIEKQRQAQLAAERVRKAHDDAWLSAKSANTIAAYEAYQKQYPNGNYYNDAVSQIEKLKKLAPSGTFKDSRDGQTYKWVRLKDGKKWLAGNLNYKTADSWCYEDKSSNCNQYGRLYTWQAAKKACPNGWRLPSDKEWSNLRGLYGGAESAYTALMQGGNSGFSALLGGSRISDGGFYGLGSDGHYWSSTEKSSSHAWTYYFYNYLRNLTSYGYYKPWGYSCRCLQD